MSKTEIRKDFFTSATPMTIASLKNFLENVVLSMHRKGVKKIPPVILWGAPGIAKSAVIEQVFGKTAEGLKTVILSQIGALDANGLPFIAKETETVDGVDHTYDVTDFSPTRAFARGKKHLFLDELNNSQPSTLAMVQNLLSSYTLGSDNYENICIVAACNPPSTNSLAMDLNHPVMTRGIHIRVDYSVDDFVNYAMETAKIHPAIVAFHKKTGGQYLQANWDYLKGSGGSYQVAEPAQNEPYPCPRSWKLASDFMMELQDSAKNGTVVDYSLLKPIVEGCVGIVAAQQFAVTYAYMTKIPDIESVYTGKLTADKFKHEKEIAVEYITMVSMLNYIYGQIDRVASEKVQCRIDTKSKDKTKNAAYNLLTGTHRCVLFIGEMASPELASLVISALSNKYRTALTGTFINTLFQGVDPDEGFTRESILKYLDKTALGSQDMNSKVG